MLKREFSRREKILLAVFAFLLLFLLYYFLVDKPVRLTMEDAQIRLDEAESQIAVDGLLVAQMHEMQAALDAMDKDKTSAVPDYENERQVVELLNKAMLMAGAFDINFRAVELGDSIVARPIDISFKCTDYSTAERIMKTLHDGPYFCEISVVDIEDADEPVVGEYVSLKYGELRVSMTITFYEYLPFVVVQ